MENNNKEKEINYIQIVKDSLKITWENKFLWWFGLLISLGGGGMSGLNYSFENEEAEEIPPETIENLRYFWSIYREWIIAGLVALFLLVFIFYILSVIGRGGLISSLLKMTKNEKADFSSGFKAGKDFFLRIFILNVFYGMGLLAVAVVMIFPIVRLAYLKVYGPALILVIAAVPIIISIIILASFLKIYSQIYLVGSGLGIFESIRSAYAVLKKNIKESLIMGIARMISGIIAGISLLILFLIIIAFFSTIGFLAYFSIGYAGAIAVAILGISTLVVVNFIWQSAFNVFLQCAWILFFNKIAAVEDKKEEKLKEEAKEKILELEKV